MVNIINKIKFNCPFAYFGSKKSITKIIWSRFGKIDNYIEPFAGSIAVLLDNPFIPKIETINDINCYLSNFWRAISIDISEVVKYADFPVHENDLHARHKWIIENTTEDFIQKLQNDPDFFDPKMAGYWVWGMGASIGNNWLQPKGLNATPLLSSAGGGIHGLTYNLEEDLRKLHTRLRRVRSCCGDWTRVISPSITYQNKGLGKNDITGIFLDPPYSLNKRSKVYLHEKDIFKEVCEWAIKNGNVPKLRIAVCGYEGDFNFPSDWECYQWKTNGGLSSLGNNQGKINSSRECVWFNPQCLRVAA